jgi:hypothetical protein
MLYDVVVVGVPEDALRLKLSVQCLVARPCRVAVFVWALYLVQAPDIAIVSLNTLSWLKAVGQNAPKIYNVGVLTRGVGS